MSYVVSLRCRECHARFPLKGVHVCEACLGPLEVEYDYSAMRKTLTRASIEARPRNLWRYIDLLPIDGTPKVGLHSGWTPLKRARNLERILGAKEIYIKDDSANYPTWSYKDRVVSVAITKAIELGYDTVGCASTGNLANSVAAHAAEAGLRAFVMIPHDLEMAKVIGSLIYGPTVVRVQGNYDDVNRLCSEIADRYGWAIVNVNLRPFYTEGAKTIGYEIAEQLGWKLPRHTVCPTAGGTLLPKIHKSYQEFIELGLVEKTPAQIHSAQPSGCDPVVRAIRAGTDEIRPQKPHTIAKSLAIGNPADGPYVARAVAESGGWAESATDDEIISAVHLLARAEGIWTEPAGGTTLAAAIKLIKSKRIPPDESICICITGNGLKAVEAVAESLPLPEPIPASLEAFDRHIAMNHAGLAVAARPDGVHGKLDERAAHIRQTQATRRQHVR